MEFDDILTKLSEIAEKPEDIFSHRLYIREALRLLKERRSDVDRDSILEEAASKVEDLDGGSPDFDAAVSQAADAVRSLQRQSNSQRSDK